MLTVIGLGSAGCNIAEMFENRPEYKVKLIDVDIEGENCFAIKQQPIPELYEKNCPDLSNFFSDVTDEILLIVAGSGKISGVSLGILKQLKTKQINILYIKPDTSVLGTMASLQEKLTFNVFQEYARSGVFKKIYLVNNPDLESVLGDIPIIGYYEKLNELIFNSFHSIYKFENTKAIIDNSTTPKEISRIASFGIYDIEKNHEQFFFPLDFVDDKCYYFAINENDLKSNGKLFKLIKDRIKEKVTEKTKISYKIYSTNLEQNYCYMLGYSRKIQS